MYSFETNTPPLPHSSLKSSNYIIRIVPDLCIPDHKWFNVGTYYHLLGNFAHEMVISLHVISL